MPTWNGLTSETIESSNWFEDDLSHSLYDYSALLNYKQSDYDKLINERNNLIEERSLKEQSIADVESQLKSVRAIIDVNQSQGIDASQELAEESTLEWQLSKLNNEKSLIQAKLISNSADINSLADSLSMDKHFTEEQLQVIDSFTNTDHWINDNISSTDELIKAGKEYFATINHPSTNLKISLVDLLKIADIPDNVKFLELGSKINIYYEPFDINVQTQIIEMDINYDTGSIDLVIANTTRVKKDEESELADLIYSNAQIAGQVTRDKYMWDDIPEVKSTLHEFLNNKLNAALHEIVAGANETVTINERGVTITDSNDPLRLIRMTNGAIGLLRNGNYVGTAITADGVWADHVIGKLLLGEKLLISDGEGTFQIDGNLLTVKDREEITRLLLGEYEDNKFGLKLMNKTGQDVVLDENGILQTWQEGNTDNVDASNGLTLNIYLPDDTISIRKAILNFKLLLFRAYSKGTASGGGNTQTSSSGGGVSTSTASGGGTSTTSGAGGDHTHLMYYPNGSTGKSAADYQYYSYTAGAEGGVGALLDVPTNSGGMSIYTYGSSGNHSHTVTTDAHTHDVTIDNHSHTVTIPNHSHGIDYGIYTDTIAKDVGIIINGMDRTTDLGGLFNTDQNSLDITSFLTVGQWNEIELTSSQKGRIDANIFMQAFMST